MLNSRSWIPVVLSRCVTTCICCRAVGPSVFRGKFCQIPRASLQNSAAYRDKIVQISRLTAAFHLSVNWALSCCLKTLLSEGPTGMVTLCWVMLRTYKENYLYFFVLKMQSVKLCCVCLRLCLNAIAISRARSFSSLGFDFFMSKICHQVKNRTNRRWICNFCKIPSNSPEISKFRGKGRIHGLARNSASCGELWALQSSVCLAFSWLSIRWSHWQKMLRLREHQQQRVNMKTYYSSMTYWWTVLRLPSLHSPLTGYLPTTWISWRMYWMTVTCVHILLCIYLL